MNQPKPGYKTTELWISLASTVVILLLTYGVFTQAEADAWSKVILALVNLLPSLVYVVGRVLVKRSANNGNGYNALG